mgnify:CR=1 FL=1
MATLRQLRTRVASIRNIQRVTNAMYMVAAAKMSGGVNGPNIKAAMEQFRNHVPAELQGVCIPSTWTAEDHRGTTKVFIYRANSKGGQQSISKAGEAEIPRKPEWLGW